MKPDDPRRKNLKPFPKGVSGNPQGARLHDPVKKAIRRLTNIEVAEVMSLVLAKDLKGLQAIAKDPTSTVLKVWVASTAIKGIQRGDGHMLNVLLNRTSGAPAIRLEHTGADGAPIQTAALTSEERKKLIDRYLRNLKETDE